MLDVSFLVIQDDEIADFKRPVKKNDEVVEEVAKNVLGCQAMAIPPIPKPVMMALTLYPRLSKKKINPIDQMMIFSRSMMPPNCFNFSSP
jgi:hypothetical protein